LADGKRELDEGDPHGIVPGQDNEHDLNGSVCIATSVQSNPRDRTAVGKRNTVECVRDPKADIADMLDKNALVRLRHSSDVRVFRGPKPSGCSGHRGLERESPGGLRRSPRWIVRERHDLNATPCGLERRLRTELGSPRRSGVPQQEHSIRSVTTVISGALTDLMIRPYAPSMTCIPPCTGSSGMRRCRG
jgi:hypothetical protein